MKKLLLIITFFCWVNALFAQEEPRITLSLIATGENLTWSISGNLNGENPNIFSELDWSNVTGAGYAIDLLCPVYKRLLAFTDFSHSLTFAGQVTDSDYENDDRQDRVFFAREDAGKGQVIAGRVGVMYQVVGSERIRLSLGTGYGWLNQQLYLTKKEEGLNSSYKNHWYGPLLAQTVGYQLSEKLSMNFTTIYHQVHYRAKADWNLIEYFQHPVSFRHRAKGFGLDTKLSIKYEYQQAMHFFIAASYAYWTTGSGIDELYKIDDTSVKTRLNDVTRRAVGCSLGVAVRF